MIVTSLVSSKIVAEHFYASTGIQNEITEDDLKLWIGEVYDLIGTKGQFIKKIIGSKQDTRYEFDNYTVPLPCDFASLIPGGVIVNGQSVHWDQNSFHYLKDGDCCDLGFLNSHIIEEFTDQFGNQFSPQVGTVDGGNDLRDVTFQIQQEAFTFNIKKGKACVAYWAYPFDNEGWIMIPNTAKYIRAVTDYVIWKYDYIQWRQQVIPRDVYMVSEENKRWGIASAANEIKMMDGDQMELMKNLITRLLPKFNEYNHRFSTSAMETRRFR